MATSWRVQNELSAGAIPAEQWATATRALLDNAEAVISFRVHVAREPDHVDAGGHQLEALVVEAVVEATDGDAAITTVEQAVMQSLDQVASGRELGWTAYDWLVDRRD